MAKDEQYVYLLTINGRVMTAHVTRASAKVGLAQVQQHVLPGEIIQIERHTLFNLHPELADV